MNRTHAGFIPFLVVVVAVFGIGIAATNTSFDFAVGPQALASPFVDDVPSAAESLSAAFEEVADVVLPSVVTVRATKEVELAPMLQRRQFFFGTPFEDFFGDRGFPQQPAPGQRRFQQGEGSGFVVRADGYILTNHHVVQDADEVTVILPDDRTYNADVVGVDPKTDLAVIKIDSEGLTPARLGDSEALRVGQWVIAAGNPFGLSSSITTGIVSAKGRSRVGITDYEDFIQTDAAINRGNSGGPLVNLRGEVVGINTAILSRTGGNVGIGFAIPINLARTVMDDLIEDGRVVRGFLGVLIQDLSRGMADSFGYDGTNGALISEVTEDGPAAAAGLEPGDIITRFNGRPVRDSAELRLRVAAVDPGTKVRLGVFRDGASRTFDVKVGELPNETPVLAAHDGETDLGLRVETLTPEVATRVGVDGDLRGVVVTQVEPIGPAGRAGLRRGDVITHVHRARVHDASEFHREIAERNPDDGVRLTIQSGVQRRFVFLSPRP